MPLAKTESWRVTFTKVGCPEYYALLRDPRDGSAGESRHVSRAMMILMRAQMRQEPLEQDEMWALDALHDLVRTHLREWNLPRYGGAGDEDVVPLTAPDLPPPPEAPTAAKGEKGAKVSKQDLADYDQAVRLHTDAVAVLREAYDPLALIDERLYTALLGEMRQRLQSSKSA